MTLEYLIAQKHQYQQRQEYYQKIGFDRLASEFQSVVDLINEMENYLKEKENGKD